MGLHCAHQAEANFLDFDTVGLFVSFRNIQSDSVKGILETDFAVVPSIPASLEMSSVESEGGWLKHFASSVDSATSHWGIPLVHTSVVLLIVPSSTIPLIWSIA